MTLAIHRLIESRETSPEAIDAFLGEQERFPIVEGASVTFVYRGGASQVLLQHFIYGLPTSQPFSRVEGTDLWFLVLELPEGSRLQYKINVIHGDDHNWILDPLNPEKALDPYGANSVCYSGGLTRPEWTYPHPETRPGEIRYFTMYSEAFQENRSTAIYLPARYRETRRYPLLVVHDGGDYVR